MEAHVESRLLRMIDNMPVAVMTVDPDSFAITYANETSKNLIRQIEHLLPISADQLVGSSIDVFHRHPTHQRGLISDPANLPHSARIRLGPESLDLTVTAITADDGSFLGPMLTWAIVTREVAAEERILRLAQYDTLTGLANRNTFQEWIEAGLEKPDHRMAIFFLDLDGFKTINDTRGHGVGDTLLKMVADRLRNACDHPDMKIGRIGGDEFAVILHDDNAERAETLAANLVAAIGTPYSFGDHANMQIGTSIGIAYSPAHGRTVEQLLSRADIALYAAKYAGKGKFTVFEPAMGERIRDREHLKADLRATLQTMEDLFVFYQPIVEIQTRRVTAREALVRWYHPDRGWISPAEFIPVAEESGLIEPLGRFILHRACADATTWEDEERVAVNISAAQFGGGMLVDSVREALEETGLRPDRLEIEVTETALLGSDQGVIEDFGKLRALGVRIALDDFGTGYSSLAHLRAYPFDKIKIDGSFVRDAVTRPDCAAVVKAIADLGRRLGVTTVAEGVETQEHLARVTEEGCSEIQGYLIRKPGPSERDAPRVEAINRALRLKQQKS
ncbi:putative bifunctional diguanylate cyclase/phosphodiesterase [Acetobacter conturbans]|uniref:EAL domain-containing protein n=1 Tax=Acetobacter conturbans TaxID=1737472 RepID=A0ABX0K1E6_9PROT|nr:EAL domain-containing protein [Acetobacter conturbans]NHN88098.1 EAL domain-containing protein [Acetobacter conturbans]